jgi:hypothetical protein
MTYQNPIKLYVISDLTDVPPPLRGTVQLASGAHYYFVDHEREIALLDYEAAGTPEDIFARDAAAWTIEWGADPFPKYSDWENVYDEASWETADFIDCAATYENGNVTWH